MLPMAGSLGNCQSLLPCWLGWSSPNFRRFYCFSSAYAPACHIVEIR